MKCLTPDSIMSELASQRNSDTLCDVKLKVEGKVIPAHRAVLAAASPFFHGMFTADFKEREDKIVVLNDITSEALNMVVDCIYTFKIELTNEMLPGILAASHMLQIGDIVEQCKKHMTENISDQSCLTFMALAEKYDFTDLAEKANEFIPANFIDIRKTPEFTKLSKDALCNYLSDNTINIKGNEFEVFEAACT